ncbi:MAG: hypothetical protein HY926_15095 [Elusimicrobia bacterium]|nr:hypothetical protein [Elusimicrobiota bacterium]
MLIAALVLLCAGAAPASSLVMRLEVRPVSVQTGPAVSWSGPRPSAPLSPLVPLLSAPSLSPLPVVPVLHAAPAAAVAAAPAAPVLGGLALWYAQSSEDAPPDAPALARLWDGGGKAPAAPEAAVSPVPDGGSASAPVLAAPNLSGSAEFSPGSVFDWKPVESSPDHGLPLVDRVVRWVLGRQSGRFGAGYEMTDSPRREAAQVFFYGERHSDQGLIKENMRRIASDLRPGQGALILDEGYLGPTLYGSAALEYLEKKGLELDWLGERADSGAGIEVAGWDDREVYDRSKHPLLQHHMNLLDLNHHLYSAERGLRYYRDLAAKAWETLKNWRVLRRLAITERNAVLDRAVQGALDEAERTGQSLHVIAGGEHLVERPLLAGRPQMRRGLVQALGGRAYWAGMPIESSERP